MFEAMWVNFYNAFIRNVSPVLRGGIITLFTLSALMCIIYSMKKAKSGKLIGNWFLFFLAIVFLGIVIIYTFVV